MSGKMGRPLSENNMLGRPSWVYTVYSDMLVFVFGVIVYAAWHKQHTVRLGHGSESIVDPQCTIDCLRVVYK